MKFDFDGITVIHGIFYLVLLIIVSAFADKYHKQLKKINLLNKASEREGAKKDKINLEVTSIRQSIHSLRKTSLKQLGIVAFVFFLFCLLNYKGSRNYQDSQQILNLFSAPGGFIVSALILQAVYFLKGKGGGIPSNHIMDRFPTDRY
ncbi:hypothetical protein K6119_11450 [Paracrocinitomix mangrovi]|uniref:hypothetical protein n=1 Tax=Paracrocinitomix mangrovi TaxID=2862509 RepID=UPI001C8EF4F7|nr:hypothetical protein [Paracrocinitomix mangrovi]UKN00350.1 hypothetical protein K6119_11450 [Paracrocinitomix mangrovi]